MYDRPRMRTIVGMRSMLKEGGRGLKRRESVITAHRIPALSQDVQVGNFFSGHTDTPANALPAVSLIPPRRHLGQTFILLVQKPSLHPSITA